MDKFNFEDNKVIIGIIFIIIIIFICVFFYTRSKMEEDYNELEDFEILQNTTDSEIIEEDEKEKIVVHVTGAVKNEGIVEIKEGARIADAVEASGGFSEIADISQINLAYQLEDGQKIYIPSINDEKVDENDKVLQKEYITEEAGDEVIIEDNDISVKSKESKININTAKMSELEEIPGVGEATAQKIMEYREQNGKFKNIEDIKNVSGIGDSKFENMKDKICVK